MSILLATALLSSAGDVPAAELEPSGFEDLDAALVTLADGDLQAGCAELEFVAAAGGREGVRAEQIGRLINGLDPRACTWVSERRDIATDGRTELIISQTVIWPGWFATAPGVYTDSASPAAVGGLLIVGLGVGLGGTWALTRDRPVRESQAMMVYTGELLGVWSGLALEAIVTADERAPTGQPAHLGTVVGGMGGLAAAAIAPRASAGDVALVRSGLVWGTGLAGTSAVIGGASGPRTTFGVLYAGTLAGLGSTLALTPYVELRRGQVNTINLAGYAGGLVGGGVALIAQSDERTSAGLVTVGAVAGLVTGVTIIASDGGPDRSAQTAGASASFAVLPDGDGNSHPGLTVSGRW